MTPNFPRVSAAEQSSSVPTSLFRGLRLRCPNCGESGLFRRYLKPVDACAACGERFGHIRADDAPPWLTIIIVGHILVPLILFLESWNISTGTEIAMWVPAALILTLILLPRCKGALIGMMWSLGMGRKDQL